jgi:hypothetical protein
MFRGVTGLLFLGAIIIVETIGWIAKHIVGIALIAGAAYGGYHLYNKDTAKTDAPAATQPQTAAKTKEAAPAPVAKPQVAAAPVVEKAKESKKEVKEVKVVAAPVKSIDLKALEISAAACRVVDNAPAMQNAVAVTYEFNNNSVTYSMPGKQDVLAFKAMTDAEKARAEEIVKSVPHNCRVAYFNARDEIGQKTGITGLKRALGL